MKIRDYRECNNQNPEPKMTEIKIGDWVGFKSDIEQSGQIAAISGSNTLLLKNENGFSGDYIGGNTKTTESADDCWID